MLALEEAWLLVPPPAFVEAPGTNTAVHFVRQLHGHCALSWSLLSGDNMLKLGNFMINQEGCETVTDIREGITANSLVVALRQCDIGAGFGKQLLKYQGTSDAPWEVKKPGTLKLRRFRVHFCAGAGHEPTAGDSAGRAEANTSQCQGGRRLRRRPRRVRGPQTQLLETPPRCRRPQPPHTLSHSPPRAHSHHTSPQTNPTPTRRPPHHP